MRRNRALVSIAVAALVATAAPLGAESASAASAAIRCGDTITTNVVLTKNLTCPGNGLGGDAAVTIDLNGHTLAGSGVGAGIGGLSVKNGTIRGFDIGLSGSVNARSVKFVSNRVGIIQFNPSGTIVDSTFDSNRDAGVVTGEQLAVINSTFRNNGIGVRCGDANLTVTGSRFKDNTIGVVGDTCGVDIYGSSFSGGDVAVQAYSVGYYLDVRNNSFTGSGIGLELSGVAQPSTHAIVRNTFNNNRASGLVVRASDATFGLPVVVSGNTFTGNGFSPGSNVDPTGGRLTSGVWANSGTFTNNRATANAGHGIEVYNAVDGGSNTARSNRTVPQCLGVVCATR